MKNTTLRQWRKNNGFTVIVAAKILGCSVGHYSEIERGIKRPSLLKAYTIERRTKGFVTVYNFIV